MASARRPTYTELDGGRRGSYLDQIAVVAHSSARRGKQHLYIIVSSHSGVL